MHFPAATYEDRPYDWSAPYDHGLEGSLEPAPVPSDPMTAYPYDQAGPYDWEMEGVFDDAPDTSPTVSRRNMYLDTLGRMRGLALAGAGVMAAMAALVIGTYELKKDVFALDARDVPAKLPPRVADMAASAVKVEYNNDLPSASWGSGVKIGPDLVLTAGHVVLEGNEDNRLDCESSYAFNAATFDYDYPDWIVDRQAVYDESEDMAVLRVRPDDAFDALPTARIAADQPSKGEPVFFVNYESGHHPSAEHYPNSETAYSLNRYDMSGVYDHAAEYAGIVLGQEGSRLAVATGQRGYGPEEGREVNTYPGGSGGPVFNRAGELVGEVNATYSENNALTVMRHTINVPHRGSDVQVSWIQPVTKESVQELIDGLPETPAC
jgi:hypothetical protein